MKRIAVILCLLALAFGMTFAVTGCSSSGKTESSSASAAYKCDMCGKSSDASANC